MITISCIFLIVLICGMVALIAYLACNHEGNPISEIKKPTPAPPPKKPCYYKLNSKCAYCKCLPIRPTSPIFRGEP